SRARACAGWQRREQVSRVLQNHSAGSVSLAGKINCRAVGRRRRRLSGRKFPGAVLGVERKISRRDARFLARGRRPDRRNRLSLNRESRSLPSRWTWAICEREFHYFARWIYPERSGQLQRQTQRSERRTKS